MKKVLFLDRDGTIIIEPPDEQVDSLEELHFLPGVITSLAGIVKNTDYELVLVTNQDGLGTASFPEISFWSVQNKMLEILRGEGIEFSAIFIDRTFPEDHSPTRKPGTALLTKFLAQGIDLESSFVIGDRETDIQLARNLGCRAIYINGDEHSDAVFNTLDWNEIYRFLEKLPRQATIERMTGETQVKVSLNLDGTGTGNIETGIAFFDHMLDQVAKHGAIDLIIKAKGDLNVDMHHTIEDVAIVLGQAISQALGKKKGIERYGFMLPMDDSLACVALDLGGRPWLVWDMKFECTQIGEIPVEMFYHFFKSLSDNALCNLNIQASGKNSHHMIEAVFKAFARALKMAVRKTGNEGVPTTKELL